MKTIEYTIQASWRDSEAKTSGSSTAPLKRRQLKLLLGLLDVDTATDAYMTAKQGDIDRLRETLERMLSRG